VLEVRQIPGTLLILSGFAGAQLQRLSTDSWAYLVLNALWIRFACCCCARRDPMGIPATRGHVGRRLTLWAVPETLLWNPKRRYQCGLGSSTARAECCRWPTTWAVRSWDDGVVPTIRERFRRTGQAAGVRSVAKGCFHLATASSGRPAGCLPAPLDLSE
jgi:hypothetical protein